MNFLSSLQARILKVKGSLGSMRHLFNSTDNIVHGVLVNPVERPCKHQHDVDNKYKLSSYSILTMMEDKGLHAIVALVVEKAGDTSFYSNII